LAMAKAAVRPQYDVIIVGAGMCGMYQLHRSVNLGLQVALLEAGADLGGTWFWNRYPGARFDSESYSYGYSFSKEILQEWDWRERFSAQPENLVYLNYVADKLGLRKYMQFNSTVESAHFDEADSLWRLHLNDGRYLTCRFFIPAIGVLSAPTLPKYEGLQNFRGKSFHTYDWPQHKVDFVGKRVAVIGTGATGVQVISAIADEVGDLHVFQRRPNWCVPLHNAELSSAEMSEIKSRYDDIFALCARTMGGFIHEFDLRPFFDVPRDERLAKFEKLYNEPGFGIWLGNFRDILIDERANAEISEFIANKIRSRVHNRKVAEQLIPTDHGFGVQRVPMETGYYEVYNRDNVQLVNLSKTPIKRITTEGIQTTDAHYKFDIIVYATGFDAITGSYDRIGIHGVGGQTLRKKWSDGPVTFLGLQVSGFPNMIMPTGPQSGGPSTNFPRAIEIGVDWTTNLLKYMQKQGYTREEATVEAEQSWHDYVRKLYTVMLMRTGHSWFTGYNSNVAGHEKGTIRYPVFLGGTPKYRAKITAVADANYAGISFQ
jgi:cation diffusion facilitator CzcD-associated flavoprotein CzcO